MPLDYVANLNARPFFDQLDGMGRKAEKTSQGISRSFELAGGNIISTLGARGGVFGALAAGLVGVGSAGDRATKSLGRLNAATNNTGDAREVFSDLKELAAETGAEVHDSVGAFSRFSIASKQIGATNEEVTKLIGAIQKAGIISGSSVQELNSASTQLGQAFASDRLGGDELKSLMENLPLLAQELAEELNVPVGKLRELGEQGQLTASKVFPAMLKAADAIDAKFQQMPLTAERAWNQLWATVQNVGASIDGALGLSSLAASAMTAYAGNPLDAFSDDAEEIRYQKWVKKKREEETASLKERREMEAEGNQATDPSARKMAEERSAVEQAANEEMRRIRDQEEKDEMRYRNAMEDMHREIAAGEERRIDDLRQFEREQSSLFEDFAKAERERQAALNETIKGVYDNIETLRSQSSGTKSSAVNFGMLSSDERRSVVRAENDRAREESRQDRMVERAAKMVGITDDTGKQKRVDARFGAQREGRNVSTVALDNATITALATALEVLVAE